MVSDDSSLVSLMNQPPPGHKTEKGGQKDKDAIVNNFLAESKINADKLEKVVESVAALTNLYQQQQQQQQLETQSESYGISYIF